jgi:uncharacterized protein YjdB
VRRLLPFLMSLVLGSRLLAAQNVAEVQVTPETVTLRVGQKQALFAAAFDPSGNLIPTARFTYASNNPTVAQAQVDGTVVGLKSGAAIVRVSAGQKIFSVAVSVESASLGDPHPEPAEAHASPAPSGPPPSVLTIEPTPVYLLPSENLHLTANAYRDDGTPADLTRVTWKSLTPETATVDADGVVVGLVAGHGIVQAGLLGGVAATVPVEVIAADFSITPSRLVLAPDDLDTLVAYVPTQNNRALRGGLQWRSGAPETIRVGPTGIVQAMAPGETEIIVTGFFQERRIPVVVHPPVQTLVVAPKPSAGVIRLPLRGTRALSVRAEAADSSVVSGATLWWEVADTTIVSLDVSRIELTARKVGTTSVTLRAHGFDPITWVIEVVPGGIAIDLTRFSLELGTRMTLKAGLLDERGSVMAPADGLRWSSDNAAVAVVGNDGVVEATGFGHAKLTAETPWGKTATADVYVPGDVLFTANRGGAVLGIYQLALRDPSHVVPLLADNFQNVQATLSPDRTTIAFSSNRAGDFDLYLMDADGSNLRQLTTDPGADGDPAWFPDGSRIAYSSARSGSTQIYSIKVDGTDQRQLTTAGGGNQSPVLSPDGRSIAFISGRDGNDEVYRMDTDGANQVNLSGTREPETSPVYFPNGDLAYAAEVKHKGWQVIRIPADGSTAMVLATDLNPITSFGLSRDGERLAIVAGRVIDPRRGRAEFSFSIQALSGGAPFLVPLMANEQIVRPGF